MNDFEYSYPTRVHFGMDALGRTLPDEIANMGDTVMLAYGSGSIKRNGIYERVVGMLRDAGKAIVEFNGIMPNPTYAKVQEGAALARDNGVDHILAVGGGSTIDCCKIVACQAKTSDDIWAMEYSEHRFPADALGLGAVVTVSGTGAEMNAGAVITNEVLSLKAPLFGVAPAFAVLDPALTASVPRMQVLSGAFDNLSHSMETYFGTSGADNPSDALALAVMKTIVVNMRRLLVDIDDMQARGN